MKYFTTAVLLALIALCAVLFFLPGKIRTKLSEKAQTGRIVAATTYPIWLFARDIMDGTGSTAQLLMPPDAGCPHDYTLTTNDLMKISGKPLLLFKNGAGLDDHLCRAAFSANKHLEVVDTSEGIERIGGHDADEHDRHDADGDHDDHDDHDAEHEAEDHHHHHHGGENGHFFASPYEARKIVATITAALAENDPANAEKYRENAAKLDKRLQMLGDEFKAQLAPYAGIHVAAQHGVFDYLLRDCGFEPPLTIFADAETSISPAELTKMTKEFKEHGVKVIFTEPQYPDDLAKLIAKETGATVVKLDPAVSGPGNPPAGYYIDTMKNNLERMKEALSGK